MGILPTEDIVIKKDKKLIIDAVRHNCSHCGTKSARYNYIEFRRIDIENNGCLYAMFTTCCECGKTSMHLIKNFPSSVKNIQVSKITSHGGYFFNYDTLEAEDIDKIDSNIIMSIPTPRFIIDAGIPRKLKDLLIESLKCVKENALTGASACIRKAIYQFLKDVNAQGSNYDDKIKSIKKTYTQIEDYLDILKGIKGITSDQVHEDSFSSFSSDEATSYIAILEEIFKEVFVIPEERKRKKEVIMAKFATTDKAKKQVTGV